MRQATEWLTLGVVVGAFALAPSLAAQRGGAAKHPVTTTHGPKTTTTVAKGPMSKGTMTKGTTTKGTTTKTTGVSTAKGAGKGAASSSTSSTTNTGPAPTDTSDRTGPSTGTWTPTNPVAQKLATKTNLLNRMKGSLPPGTDLNAATIGFKNFGQFVAAVNVSTNLGIPFTDLKSAMTGTALDGTKSGASTVSLGQAIQQLKPGANAAAEVQKAETQATQQIGGESTATGTGTTTGTATTTSPTSTTTRPAAPSPTTIRPKTPTSGPGATTVGGRGF